MANHDTPGETRGEKAEARAQRRRWLSLAEIVGLAGDVIAGLGLWNTYDARRTEEKVKTTTAAPAPAPLVLRGRLDGQDRLIVSGAKGEVFQSQSIAFPAALGVAATTTHADAGAIETGAFDDELKAARKAAGRDGSSKRDELLPVLIETRYIVDGDVRTDRAIYDIAYAVKGGMFGSDVDLRGLAFRERGKADQARVDALWRERRPAAAVKTN